MKNIIVAKFGGTSMGNAQSIRQVAEIIKGYDSIVAVVSATSGTTDQLIELAEKALAGENWEESFQNLVSKHENIINELEIELDLSPYFENLRKLLQGISLILELSLSAKDRLLTFGERISSQILAKLLNSKAIDAYELVFTDNNYSEGNVDFEKTEKAILARVNPAEKPVITGFVAQSEEGHYITLGRGGSDYTGAIVASALNASELQIWTDVDGILNTDPRIVSDAKVLKQLSFLEAGELAYFGAKVLHPKTIKPAITKNIPVKILNTFNPSAPGTLIKNDEEVSIKSVTYKKGISIVNVCSEACLEAPGFLSKLFEVFSRNEISVDVVSTSEVSVSVTVDREIPENLISELEEFSTVKVLKGMAIICLVGNGIKSHTEVLGDLFTAVKGHNINMVSQGASQRNITFLVNEAEATEVVKKVFNKFFV